MSYIMQVQALNDTPSHVSFTISCCSQRTADCLTVPLSCAAPAAALRAAADLRRHKHNGPNSTSSAMDLPCQHHTEAKRCSAVPAQQHYVLQGDRLLHCLPSLQQPHFACHCWCYVAALALDLCCNINSSACTVMLPWHFHEVP